MDKPKQWGSWEKIQFMREYRKVQETHKKLEETVLKLLRHPDSSVEQVMQAKQCLEGVHKLMRDVADKFNERTGGLHMAGYKDRAYL